MAAAHDRHVEATSEQRQQVNLAHSNPSLRASQNNGRPPIAATSRPGSFTGAGVVGARQAGGPVHQNEAAHNAPAQPNNAPAQHTNPPAQQHNVPVQRNAPVEQRNDVQEQRSVQHNEAPRNEAPRNEAPRVENQPHPPAPAPAQHPAPHPEQHAPEHEDHEHH